MSTRYAWFGLVPVLLLAGCWGGPGSGLGGETVAVTVQGRFEKRDLTSAGWGGLSVKPTRYAYAEVVEDGTGDILVAGYLDANGSGIADVPQDAVVHVAIYADYQVPNVPGDTSFFMNGSVKRTSTAASYASAQAFNALPEWGVTSDSFQAVQGGTLTLKALESTQEAGAFNIADQGIAFASHLRDLEPSLRLPDLHAFWDPGSPSTLGTYPEVAASTGGAPLQQTPGMGGRLVFQSQVRLRSVAGSPVGDGYADGELQERFAHLLFADYSYTTAGASLVRRDNDPVPVDRGYASESTVAFVDGFCDYLSASSRGASSITQLDAAGNPSTFDLGATASPLVGAGGEFDRASVARDLLRSQGQAGPQPLWNATLATTANAYLNAPLGCYPTYLGGLKGILGGGSAAWHNIASGWSTDVTAPAYLNGSALWTTMGSLPFTVSGTLQTYASTYYYDRNQAQAYRFTQPATGPLDLQVTPTSGQDMFLELIGPTGVVAASLNALPSPGVRHLALSSLPAGTYVARVRVGYTTANNAAAGYTLDVY